MKTSRIVCDVGYGDGGKGLVTDNLCTEPQTLVVRYGGGYQCGHTVMRNGIKHVFSNYGSGTLRGCPSYFTEDTAINILTIRNEKNTLNHKGVDPVLYVHPRAHVGTPWDKIYNHYQEYKNHHGSCGMGYGACMKRSLQTPYKLYAQDLYAPASYLMQRVASIKAYYAHTIPPDFDLSVYAEEIDEFYTRLHQPQDFKCALLHEIPDIQHAVFEGSQGILLDMDHGIFPHVTYAHTTSKNALKYASGETHIHYVTRCYQTRHGNGPMTNEHKPVKLIHTDEEINTYNNYQGHFRTGELDIPLLQHAIRVDTGYHKENYNKHLVVTCRDQRPDYAFPWNALDGVIPRENRGENASPLADNIKKVDNL